MANRTLTLWLIGWSVTVIGNAAASAEAGQETAQPTAGARLFTLKIQPLLKVKCLGCHGNEPDDLRGGLDLRNRSSLLAGGASKIPSLVPGDPDNSLLYQAILWKGLEMPPKENERLTADEVETMRRWIAGGAVWPDPLAQRQIREQEWAQAENADGRLVRTSGGLSDDWTYRRYQPQDLWAFQSLRPVAPPAGFRHPVDGFIGARLAKAGIKAAQPAHFRTLIRRVSYDLTGLPPTPYQIFLFRQAYEKDPVEAWSTLVERLLASQHYGERWAQHWLDVVRYADTAGFSNDYERSNAWRYRDYVIRAFNDDKPFNQLILEQLAGDELRPGDPETLIATGYLRMGPWGTAMISQQEARQIYLDDLVHNVGQTFLSLPLRCCKCHDHKYDPIPTRDYYRLYAVFSGTQVAELPAPFLDRENRQGFAAKRKLVDQRLAFATQQRNLVFHKQETAAREWYAQHNLPYKNAGARRQDPEDSKPPRHIGLTLAEQGILKVREQDVWIWTRRLERYRPLTQAVYNGPDGFRNGRKLRRPKKVNLAWRPKSVILGGGSLAAPLDTVSPGVLSGLGLPVSAAEKDPYGITNDLFGRRLAMARWIASDKNPLTARSIVNRVWQHHFGRGLVATANNFGAKGDKPTHPELLDWLAADFIKHGWKLKRLHRLIVGSEAYRRSSRPVDFHSQDRVDPDNHLLSSFPVRRLTAEEFRDSLLLVSGELNRQVGGVPIMPEMNLEVALQPRMIQFSIAPAHQPSRTPAERNRRSIYVYRVRGQANPLLAIMDLPSPNASCERREDAATAPQAFTLMNSDGMTDRSIAFALRVQKERPGDPAQWVRRAVQLAYGRVPRREEQRELLAYLVEMQAYHRRHQPRVIQYPKQVVRSLVEEFTGEPFDFVEKLNVYDDYVPDAKPWTVTADVRALADVCLVLLNSNEFMYVY